ncbi:MAG: penicillin-binding protein 1A [Rickettsiales bacterium]|nr:penicillin-binding protein 1A [Rickettsiales bacterium]
MHRLYKIIAWSGVSLMMAAIFGFIAAAMVFSHYSKDLPSFSKLAVYKPPVTTRLYAGDDRLMAEYATEKRLFVPMVAIPKRVQQAFIAAEDKNFYTHKGVDIFGIARAMRENVANMGTGRSLVGGSTITQQVVKNFLLTNEKSFERKIKEAILAFRISNVYSKDQILELYLNEIYLGRGSYGVAAAALNYFNKALNELETEELALLAGMPKAPASYDPTRNYQGALERRNYVISRMVDDGYVTPEEGARASAAPIVLEKRAEEEVVTADYFSEEVRRKLADMYGANVLYEGGLTVKTTVNPKLQTFADDALRHALVDYDRRYGYRGPVDKLKTTKSWQRDLKAKIEQHAGVPLIETQELAVVLGLEKTKATIGLANGERGSIPLSELKWARKDLKGFGLGEAIKKPSDVLDFGDIIITNRINKKAKTYGLYQVPQVNGGMVLMDPHTGRVLAMSGGYAYENDEFNRATQARRQPGSAFKPFVYLTALENGFSPSTILMDEPIEIYQGPGKPLWRPQNYGGKYLGPTTLRVGLEKSRNTMTVRLAQMVGLGRIIQVGKRFGLYEGKVPRNYSMVLGAKETTLMKVVTAYSMIANGGRKVSASLIERIDDRDGKIIFRRDSRPCAGCKIDQQKPIPLSNIAPPEIEDTREIVVDQRIAFQVTSLLEGVVRRGTAVRAKKIGKPLAGKTGTTNDSRDTWFVGFSPDLVAGIYIGYDQPKSLGKKETGSRVALPGFIEAMDAALKDQPARPFRIPPGVRMMQVDRKTGLPPYPGYAGGQLIAEAFLVGGNIYKPPLPDGEQEIEEPVHYTYSSIAGADEKDGFDPHEGWQDSSHYMTPDEARRRDMDFQMQYRRPIQGQQQQPQQRTAYPGFENTPQSYQQQQMETLNGVQVTTPAPPPPAGYNVNARPNPYTPQNAPVAPPPNPYDVRREPVRSGGYNRDSAASVGTGGLY